MANINSHDLATRLWEKLSDNELPKTEIDFEEFALIVVQALIDQRKADQGIQPEDRRIIH